MIIFISFVIGFVTCFLIGYFIRKYCTIGNLRIDHSDKNDVPYIFLEMNNSSGGIEHISNRKYVILDVVVKNYISQ